jgi:hypothetical protein
MKSITSFSTVVIMMCAAIFVHAQDSSRVRVIAADSLAKYHIGIAKKNSSKIHLIKSAEIPWSKMTLWQKANYIIRTVVNEYRIKYPVTFWILASLLTFWLLKQISRLFKR